MLQTVIYFDSLNSDLPAPSFQAVSQRWCINRYYYKLDVELNDKR